MKKLSEMTDAEINRLLRNPMDIHKIQDKLAELPGKSLFAQAVRDNARQDINGVILMILSQARDNKKLVAEIIGEDLLTEIEKHYL